MANGIEDLEYKIEEILKAIHRIEGKVFCNDPFMHKIWEEEKMLKNNVKNNREIN